MVIATPTPSLTLSGGRVSVLVHPVRLVDVKLMISKDGRLSP